MHAETMQAGYVSAPHLGTPLDTVEPSVFARAYKGSYADRVYRQFQDSDATFSEREAAFPRFRTTLVGPTFTSPPTGGFSSPVSIVMGPEPSDAMVRHDFTSFLQPGGPPKVEVHGADGAQWTSSAPGSETVYRIPTGKQRNVHGAMTIARAEQEAERSRRHVLAQREAMFARDEAALARAVALASNATAVAATAAGTPSTNILPLPTVSSLHASANGARVMPPPLPTSSSLHTSVSNTAAVRPAAGAALSTSSSSSSRQTPASQHFQQFLHGLRSAAAGTMSSSAKSAWAAENIVYFVAGGLLILLLVLCIVVMIVFITRGKHKPHATQVNMTTAASTVTPTNLPDVVASLPHRFGGRMTTLRSLEAASSSLS